MRPYVILGIYGGLRPEEITRLDWSQINLDAGTVRVTGKRRTRLVTLEPIAVKLLGEHPLKSGPVAPSNSTVDRWRGRAKKLLKLDKWPQDLLRHTAASCCAGRWQGGHAARKQREGVECPLPQPAQRDGLRGFLVDRVTRKTSLSFCRPVGTDPGRRAGGPGARKLQRNLFLATRTRVTGSPAPSTQLVRPSSPCAPGGLAPGGGLPGRCTGTSGGWIPVDNGVRLGLRPRTS